MFFTKFGPPVWLRSFIHFSSAFSSDADVGKEYLTWDSGLCRLHICKPQPLLSFRFRPFHILSEKVWLWFLNFVGKRKHLHIFGKLIKITPYPYTYPHFSYLKSTIQNDGRCTPFHTCTLALQVQSHVVQVSQTFGPIVSMKSYFPNQVWKVWVCPHK